MVMQQHVLVTGASGVLGRVLAAQLVSSGHMVRAMSRRLPSAADSGISWVQADLATGVGVAEAVANVQTIVHAASQPGRYAAQVDVDGTRRLVEYARAAEVAHIIYVSIVGIERVPVTFYRQKLAAEQIITQGQVPWSIQRATQFHQFVDGMLQRAARLPIMLLPTDFRVQPVDPTDLARRLCGVVAGGPAGRLPDYGGPEVRKLGELAQAWLAARGQHRPMLHVPLPGAAAHAMRLGENCCPEQRAGSISWERWLEHTYGAAHGPAAVPGRG
jgi:uncharacterized protein YbjT (DUF2867 family)